MLVSLRSVLSILHAETATDSSKYFCWEKFPIILILSTFMDWAIASPYQGNIEFFIIYVACKDTMVDSIVFVGFIVIRSYDALPKFSM